jgi:endonuclease/exonuclease/phosphatase family metal-dependent hydrolase
MKDDPADEPSNEWIDRPIESCVGAITEIDLRVRAAMRDGPQDPVTHRRYFSQTPALREIELGGTDPIREGTEDAVRIAVWNVERLRHVDAMAKVLARQRPDITLLSEVDKGMARSGNRNGLALLARRLGHHFAFGVEFIELSLGDESEILGHSGETNILGLHGNALTSSLRLHRPFMVRLEVDGGWFGPARGEPRVGGRMAIGAQVRLAGRWVTFVSVHLESNSSPAERRMQVAHLLDAIEVYDAGAPILLGGDFNTSTVDRTEDRDRQLRRGELQADAARLVDVIPHEPLFRELEIRGFDWRAGNVPLMPTERPQPGQPARRCGKLDWIFTRGLRAAAPAILPALAADGTPLSDHDCLLVTVHP